MILHACALAPLIPIISASLLPLVSRFSNRARDYFTVFTASITLLLTILMIPGIFFTGKFVARYCLIPWTGVDVVVVIDALSMLMANIASFLGLLAVLYSIEYMKDESGLTRYYAFVLLFIGSMIGLVLSGNLLQLYLFWELVSVCSFFLIGFWCKKPSAVKAATKAFLVTRLGSICLLFGMLWMYNYTYTFDIVTVSGLVDKVPFTVLQACSLLFLFGAMSKSAQLPFHVWLPDAMEAPTPASALIHAATMVNAGVYLVARVSPIFSSVSAFFTVAMYVGILTAFLAATMALTANDVKRLLAYSTISQLGYMMFILGVKSSLAYFAGVFHMLNHALFKALLFLCAGAVVHAVHTRDMNLMGGLWRNMPVTFVMSLGSAMALGGLPPFNGFFSKELILDAAERAGHPYLMTVAAATSALTFAYSLKLVYKVFLGSTRTTLGTAKTPLLMRICLRVLGATCIFSVLGEEPLIIFFNKSGLTSVGNSITPYGSLQPIPLLSSVGALAFGLGAFVLRKQINKFLTAHGSTSKIISFIKGGYGFNRLSSVLSRVTISSAFTLSRKQYVDRFYNALGRSSFSTALTLSRKQYVDRFYNALGRSSSSTALFLSKKRSVDRFYGTLGRLTVAFASRVRKIQTGILGWNTIMMIVGAIGVILLTMLWS